MLHILLITNYCLSKSFKHSATSATSASHSPPKGAGATVPCRKTTGRRSLRSSRTGDINDMRQTMLLCGATPGDTPSSKLEGLRPLLNKYCLVVTGRSPHRLQRRLANGAFAPASLRSKDFEAIASVSRCVLGDV